MTLFEEIKQMYKEINNTVNEINRNIILLIENANKILDYTFNRIKTEPFTCWWDIHGKKKQVIQNQKENMK